MTFAPSGADGAAEPLAALFERQRAALGRWMERHAGGVLRFESPDDLVQGVALRVLESGATYEHRGEVEFVAWMITFARRHVADRRDWWRALKRDAGLVARLNVDGGSESGGGAPEPSATRTGPVSFADRRDRLARIVRALAALPERDADLVRQVIHDVPVAETATRLGLTYDAAQRARLRALERLRKVVALARPDP